MNKTNHKAVGRYCYGGKIYLGQCDCGRDHLIDVDQLQELMNKSFVKPKSPVAVFVKAARALSLF